MPPLSKSSAKHHQQIVDSAAAALKAAHAMYSKQPLTREALDTMEKIRDDMRMLQVCYLDTDGYGALTPDQLTVMGRLEIMADDLISAEAHHAKHNLCGSVDTTPTALRPRKKRGGKNVKHRHVASDMSSVSTRRVARGGKLAK